MIPPNEKRDYEKIRTDEFVSGTIEDVVYDKEHLFKGYQGGPDVTKIGVRLVFSVDGYKFPHKTPWMKFIYSAKSNLYKRFLVPLVTPVREYMNFDLDQLKGMKVKMLWADNGEYQNIETIRPVGEKIIAVETAPEPQEQEDSEVPF